MKLSEWRLKMTEQVQGTLSKIRGAADKVSDTFTGVQAKIKGTATGVKLISNNIEQLQVKIENLERKKRSAFSEESIRKYNGQISKLRNEMQRLENLPPSTFFDRLKKGASMLNGLGGLAAAAFSIGAIKAFGDESLRAFDSQAKVDAQLRAGIISTRGAAGKTFEELQKQASDLQKTTLFTDDQTSGAQSLLLTFTNIKGRIFNDAIPAIQNLATKMAGDGPADLKGASIQVGKALNDPIAGINALSRVGVAFTEQQKANIEGLVKKGKLAEAQAIILGELQTEFGGAAEAAAKAGLGPMQLIGNQWDDTKETIGELIMVLMNKLAPAMISVVSGISSGLQWIKDNWGLIKDVFNGIAIAVGLVSTAYVILHAKTIAMTIAQGALNLVMMLNPMYLVIAGIIALVAAIVVLWNRCEQFRGFLYGLWESFKQVFKGIGDLAKNVLGGIGEMLIGVFTFDKSKISAGFERLKNAYVDYGKGVGEKFRAGYEKGAGQVRDRLTEQEENKKKAQGAVSGSTAFAPGEAGNPSLQKGIDNISGGGKSVRNVTVNIQSLVKELIVQATTVKEGAQDIRRIVEEELLRAVQGGELALANDK